VTQSFLDFSQPVDPQGLTIAPSPHPVARENSAKAAVANLPYRDNQNARVFALLLRGARRRAGRQGVPDPVIARILKLKRQTICLRRLDLGTTAASSWTVRGRRFTRWVLADSDTLKRERLKVIVRDMERQ
jgi:hypothetical protein